METCSDIAPPDTMETGPDVMETGPDVACEALLCGPLLCGLGSPANGASGGCRLGGAWGLLLGLALSCVFSGLAGIGLGGTPCPCRPERRLVRLLLKALYW